MDNEKLLTTLIDEKNRLSRTIEELETIGSALGDAIMSLMRELEVTQALGSDGTGFQIGSRSRYAYKPEVYRLLESRGLLEHFQPKPSITRTGLKDLQKHGLLTDEDVQYIEEHTIEEESPDSLRRVVPKEARVIP